VNSGAPAPAAGQKSGGRKFIPFGRYLLLDRIAVGGMAEVYRAKAFGVEGFERIIAIKRMLPSMAEDDEFVSMFVDEAKIVANLHHANIVPIYELGRIGESHFIAMEYVWGKDLLQIMNRFRKMRSYMPPAMAALVAARLSEGLDYAHRRTDGEGKGLGIVHRDVSPQNILASYDGEVKLVDFGIATARSRSTRTQAGVLKGKFGYMSPEQARGEPLDRRSDVFAVGTCLWEMLTLERLFVAESDYHTLEKIRNVDIDPPSKKNPAVPAELERIVMKALTRDRESRWQWGSDLADALMRFVMTTRPIFGASKLAVWMKENFAAEMGAERARMADEGKIGRPDLGPATIPPGTRAAAASPTPSDVHERRTVQSPRARPAAAVPGPIHDQETVVTTAAETEPAVGPAPGGTAVFYSNEAALLEAPILNIEGPPTPSGARMVPPPPSTPGRSGPPPPPIPPLRTPSVSGARLPMPSGTIPFGTQQRPTPSPSRAAPGGRSVFKWVALGFGVTALVFGGLFAWYVVSSESGSDAPASVFVSSAPATSVPIRVDGQPAGNTPTVVPGLAPGRHVIETQSPSGFPIRQEIDVTPGGTHVVMLTVALPATEQPPPSPATAGPGAASTAPTTASAPEPATAAAQDVPDVPVRGRIVVDSTPAGAQVSLDGRVRGRTPLRLEGLDFGRYRVCLEQEGYSRTCRRVLLSRRAPSTDLSIELEQ